MASQIGTTVTVRYDTQNPEKLYSFSILRIIVCRHIFTHIVWTMRCYTLECSAMPPRYHWATPDELREEISLPTAFRQFVDAE